MLVACRAEESALETIGPTWSEFLAASTNHFEDEVIYVVDGDVAVTLEELRAEYERLFGQSSTGELGVATQLSTVNRVDGQDDLWNATTARNLTYCVSNEFGARKTRAVNELSQATTSWEARAWIDYQYVATEDGNCTGANSNVTFAVRPWASGGACAFFPSGDGCVARTIVVDYEDLDSGNYGAVTSVGIYRHELGHTLGLRHEHIRAPGTTCTIENTNWRGVTGYDSASVMHYPWCPGATNTGDLLITEPDATGISSLYRPQIRRIGLANALGATTVDGGRSYAYVKGSDGNLWVNWWSGSQWNWSFLATPPGVNIASSVGAITVDGGRPYVFVKGSDDNLWMNWWNGSVFIWSNQGRPSGVTIAGSMGVITVDGGRPYAHVKGSDGYLWTNWWNGSAWNWTNQYTP
jgi:hypothetical protein